MKEFEYFKKLIYFKKVVNNWDLTTFLFCIIKNLLTFAE